MELSSYISGGLPDISALNSGEKVIMVQESGRNTYKVGGQHSDYGRYRKRQ